MTAHDDLTAAWLHWQTATLFQTWVKHNPGEAAKLYAYRNGGPRPALATATGRALVDETSAWLATVPEEPADPGTPTSHILLLPNTYASQDGKDSNYQACWLGGNHKGNGVNDDDIIFARDGYGPHWFIHQFRIGEGWPTDSQTGQWPVKWDPASMQARVQGEWGRMINWHNPPGIPGTSAFAVDYNNGILAVHNERNNADYRLTPGLLRKGVWHTLTMQVMFSTANQGSFSAWLNGTPAAQTTGISNLYDGQDRVLYWNGFYTRGIHPGYQLPFDMMYPRRGRTLQQAIDDINPTYALGGIWGTPQPVLAWELSNLPTGTQPFVGPSTVSRIADTPTSDLQLPT